jgi:hypothetical protein
VPTEGTGAHWTVVVAHPANELHHKGIPWTLVCPPGTDGSGPYCQQESINHLLSERGTQVPEDSAPNLACLLVKCVLSDLDQCSVILQVTDDIAVEAGVPLPQPLGQLLTEPWAAGETSDEVVGEPRLDISRPDRLASLWPDLIEQVMRVLAQYSVRVESIRIAELDLILPVLGIVVTIYDPDSRHRKRQIGIDHPKVFNESLK